MRMSRGSAEDLARKSLRRAAQDMAKAGFIDAAMEYAHAELVIRFGVALGNYKADLDRIKQALIEGRY